MTPAERAALLMALNHVRIVAPLHRWPPAGALIQEALTTAQGHGSLSVDDCRRLQKWAARWEKVPETLATFYVEHAGDPDISAVLWHIFGDYARPSGARYGRIITLWVERYGYRPWFSLVHHP